MIHLFVMSPVAEADRTAYDGRARRHDVYELPGVDLTDATGLYLPADGDLRFLQRHRDLLLGVLDGGGRILLNGHPVEPVLPGLPTWRKLAFNGPDDLWLTAVDDHPVWAGVDRRDLLYRTGVPGDHDFQTLHEKVGVAGFYGRSYLADLPDDARVITAIGPHRLPLDVAVPYAEGEVVLHPGNDLLMFADGGRTTGRLHDNLLTWLEGR